MTSRENPTHHNRANENAEIAKTGTKTEENDSAAHRCPTHPAAPRSVASIERDGPAEYLLPHHVAFVIYAASCGVFVLGGLQAVFETSLHRFVADLVDGESYCAAKAELDNLPARPPRSTRLICHRMAG